MDQSTLYEEDVHAWAEHQSELLRRLAERRRDLPNDLDLDHIAEEIEDVGIAQRSAAESSIRQILVHLIKLHCSPEASPVRHWRGEIVAFHISLLGQLTPSMENRIDLDRLWMRAVREARSKLEADEPDRFSGLPPRTPSKSPIGFPDLEREEFDIDGALARFADGA